MGNGGRTLMLKKFRRVIAIGSLLLVLALLSGCCCHSHKDVVICGEGTQEQSTGTEGEKICVPIDDPLVCGDGTHEQGTGTERECAPDVACGEGTHEQGTGTERECVPDVTCGEGTHEQGTGTERECVPNEEN